MNDSISALNPFSLLPTAARPTGPATVAALRIMLTNSVPSGHTRRAYAKAFDDLLELTIRTGQPISRLLFLEYRAEMVDAGLGSSTINVRLSGVRKLVNEARENGLVDPADAERCSGSEPAQRQTRSRDPLRPDPVCAAPRGVGAA